MSSSYIGNGHSGATFSPCRTWRYSLWRRFEDFAEPDRMVAFIGLNPSTADEMTNDPTVTRCIGFARRWSYEGMVMLNLFGIRATDPKVMLAADDPVGEENDVAILECAKACDLVVCCWGNHGLHRDRWFTVRNLLRQELDRAKLVHLGMTRSGQPKHPLYLKADTTAEAWD